MRAQPTNLDPLTERARSLVAELGDVLVELAARGSPPEPEPVYNLAQVAALLQQSPSTIRRLRRAGKLRPIPYRGKPVVTASELRRFLAADDGEAGS